MDSTGRRRQVEVCQLTEMWKQAKQFMLSPGVEDIFTCLRKVVDLWTKPKFRQNHIGGLQSVKIRRIFRHPNYFSADFRRQ